MRRNNSTQLLSVIKRFSEISAWFNDVNVKGGDNVTTCGNCFTLSPREVVRATTHTAFKTNYEASLKHTSNVVRDRWHIVLESDNTCCVAWLHPSLQETRPRPERQTRVAVRPGRSCPACAQSALPATWWERTPRPPCSCHTRSTAVNTKSHYVAHSGAQSKKA